LYFSVVIMCFMFLTENIEYHSPMFIFIHVMSYALFRIKINRILSLIPTIQKLDRAFSVAGFAAQLKPNMFDGTNYKRWVGRVQLWLMAMNVWFIVQRQPEGPRTLDEERAFQAADNLFRGAVISVLGENLVDTYMHIPTGKELWDTLEAKFGVSDAGSEHISWSSFLTIRWLITVL
jgi:hypothetical protein